MGRGRGKRRGAVAHGVLLIDKPRGVTSFDVIRSLRRATKVRKMGHTGTLDPMATGLLVICLGEATKLVPYLTADSKRYEAEVSFGVRTNTYDADGDVVSTADSAQLAQLDRAQCERALSAFLGEQQQRPPAFSAIKVNGERLYERARRGEEVEVPLRQVTFHELTLHTWSSLDDEASSSLTSPRAHIEVYSSKGTYIRSLASDLGDALGVGAHLTALRRTAAGGFKLSEAHTLESITEESLTDALIPLVDALPEAPLVKLTDDQALAVRQGKSLTLTPELSRQLTQSLTSSSSGHVEVIRATSESHELIALLRCEGDQLRVARGFAHP